MTFIGAIGAIGGAIIAGNASRDASNAQVEAIDRSNDVNERMFNKVLSLQEPFRQAGLTGQDRLLELLGLGVNTGSLDYGKYGRDFSMSDFATDPGYSFRLKEGLKALDASAAARGGLMSGAILKAAQRYGQDYGSNEYEKAFNRYQINRTNQLAPLQGLTGTAQTAATTMGVSGDNYASRVGDNFTQVGNARASGYIGGANALNNALSSISNYYQSQDLLKKLSG